MKKFFIAALMTVTFAASAFAKDIKVNTAVAHNFKAEFAKASNVNWITTNEYTKASFVLNNEKMEVFYNAAGEKIATSRSVTVDALPIKAKRTLARNYAAYNIKEAIEFEGIDDEAYFISAENEKASLVLKVDKTGALTIFKNTRK